MKNIFIINTISGKGDGLISAGLIKEVATELNADYELVYTEYEGHATEIAAKYSSDQNNIIYAVGGDGTILEVLNGLDLRCQFGIIPAGSGNDYFRHYDLGSNDKKELIRKVILADPVLTDFGICNGRRFMNTASFGMDASINLEASKYIRKTILNKDLAYVFSIIRNVVFLRPIEVTIEADDRRFDGEFYIAAVMNGRFYGNGIMAAPKAVTNDGLFDICLFRKAPKFKTYRMLIKYLSGKHTEKDGFEVFTARRFRIISHCHDLPAQNDGENYYCKDSDIRISHNELKLKMPGSQ